MKFSNFFISLFVAASICVMTSRAMFASPLHDFFHPGDFMHRPWQPSHLSHDHNLAYQRCVTHSNLLPLQSTKFEVSNVESGYEITARLPQVDRRFVAIDSDKDSQLITVQAIRHPPRGCERLVESQRLKKEFRVSDALVDWNLISASFKDDILRIFVPIHTQNVPNVHPTQTPSSPRSDHSNAHGHSYATSSQTHQSPTSPKPTEASIKGPSLADIARALEDFNEDLLEKSKSSQPLPKQDRPSSSESARQPTNANTRDLIDGQGNPRWFHIPVSERVQMPNAKRHQFIGDDGLIVL